VRGIEERYEGSSNRASSILIGFGLDVIEIGTVFMLEVVPKAPPVMPPAWPCEDVELMSGNGSQEGRDIEAVKVKKAAVVQMNADRRGVGGEGGGGGRSGGVKGPRVNVCVYARNRFLKLKLLSLLLLLLFVNAVDLFDVSVSCLSSVEKGDDSTIGVDDSAEEKFWI
jgi:hypothetical protein